MRVDERPRRIPVLASHYCTGRIINVRELVHVYKTRPPALPDPHPSGRHLGGRDLTRRFLFSPFLQWFANSSGRPVNYPLTTLSLQRYSKCSRVHCMITHNFRTEDP